MTDKRFMPSGWNNLRNRLMGRLIAWGGVGMHWAIGSHALQKRPLSLLAHHSKPPSVPGLPARETLSPAVLSCTEHQYVFTDEYYE